MTPMTPEDMKALWASHCKYEFELRDVKGALSTMVDNPHALAQVGLLDPAHVPAFGVDTAARLRDLPPS
jgi:hypothetical protein